jgi:hypothetical protein
MVGVFYMFYVETRLKRRARAAAAVDARPRAAA